MTPDDLEKFLAVAKKYRVIVLKIGEVVVQMEPAPQDFTAEPSNTVVNGGWKRGPDLTED
jgi:hypothetical protein